MRAAEHRGRIEGKRLLSIEEAAEYTGIGRNTAREWLEKIGARRNFGRRVVYDRRVIDSELDRMAASKPHAVDIQTG
ncbi:MAG: helix-turn-helix domain-containing protein [Eubacteriales bacterium]|nr:helix-turn-helix domain-containing protein [Eubacteriales bacterium]